MAEEYLKNDSPVWSHGRIIVSIDQSIVEFMEQIVSEAHPMAMKHISTQKLSKYEVMHSVYV